MYADENTSTWPAGGQLPRKAAFTLVEVICSIAIAAFVVSALFYGFSNGYAMLGSTREDLRATQILMQRTEVIRLLTWTQLASCPTTFTESYNQASVSNSQNGIIYYGTLSVTTATNIPDTAIYKSSVELVTIAVVWTNNTGSVNIPHRREMQTLSAKNGMQNYLDGGGS
jgi:prepilin-type N-terminal cleavage/methylation domain-containing protein